jgi:hypothetical protein
MIAGHDAHFDRANLLPLALNLSLKRVYWYVTPPMMNVFFGAANMQKDQASLLARLYLVAKLIAKEAARELMVPSNVLFAAFLHFVAGHIRRNKHTIAQQEAVLAEHDRSLRGGPKLFTLAFSFVQQIAFALFLILIAL